MAETAPISDKSTNDRISLVEASVRAGFRVLNHVPFLAAPCADTLFFKPPRHRLSPRGRRFLASGERLTFEVGDARLAAWSWGAGPTVLLVHGWGGRASQMSAFVPALRAEGYRVVAFDAPAHGESSGFLSSALDFARAVEVIVRKAGPVKGIVAHSLGSTGVAVALSRGVVAQRVVLIGPPADPTAWASHFARRFRVSVEVMRAMRARSERRLGASWSLLELSAMAPLRGTPLLVIHDREDREVAFAEGQEFASALRAELVATRGLGHRRILRDPDVVRKAVAFVSEKSVEDISGSSVLGESGALDRYLYERDDREAFASSRR
jgi:pimeloyl-ACP methyl ester carboxylesterase